MQRCVRVLVFLVTMSMCVSAASAAYADPSPDQIYWGAFNWGPMPPDLSAVSAFEQQAGKKMSIVPFGSNWRVNGQLTPFNTAAFEAVRQHGSIPLFSWTSQGGSSADFTNAKITSGAYDAYITQWATAARNWGHPFFLKFDHEMDGWWYPWAEGSGVPGGPITNGNTPGSYVAMYRHVHDIFTAVGATNVTWVWCVNQENTTGRYPALSQVYPGDAYVDWSGIDAYNRYTGLSWQTFDMLFHGWINPEGDNVADTYQRVMAVAPLKPMMIPEIGAIEDSSDPNHKAVWFRDAYITQMVRNFPAMKAIIYYNVFAPGDPLRTDSSALSQAAFSNSIALSAYATNTFSQLGAGKIAPAPEQVAYLAPVADTFISSDAPNSVSGGASSTLSVSGSSAQTRKAFLRFDLRSLAGKQLDQAVLQLSVSSDAAAGSIGTINVKYDANNSWQEPYMSWTNHGGPWDVAQTPVSTLVAPSIPGSPYVAVLSPSWVAGHTGGFLSFEMDTTSTDNVTFMAREAADPGARPQLVIAYR